MSAAFTAPAALSIITTTFAEGPARNRALSIFTTCGASGFSLGLVLAGVLTEVGWRWTFLMPAPDRADRCWSRRSKLLPSTRQREGHGGYDLPGAVTDHRLDAAAGRTPSSGARRRLGSARTIASFAAAVVLLAAFVVDRAAVEAPAGPARHPALRPASSGPTSALVTFFGSYVGFQFVGHAVPAERARLVGAGDRAGLPARRRCWWPFGSTESRQARRPVRHRRG